jgi:hypothetical protein
MIPGRAKSRKQLPWLPYPKQDQMYVINAHNFNTVSDPDAAAYIAAVETADGQSLEAGVRTAIDTFVIGCKADGIWTAIKAACIMAGARTLAGALVPLVGPAPTNFNFVSGDYNRETGLVGNGTTKYLNSNRNVNADPQNSYHQSIYVANAPTGGPSDHRTHIGAGAAGTGSSQINTLPGGSGGEIRFFNRNGTGNVTLNVGNVTGLIAMSRSSSANYVSRFNNSNTTNTQSSQTPHNGNALVFARNSASNVPGNFSNARMSWYSIGESLDLALLDARLSTLMTDIAAAI